jgi:hypothetical protein
MSNLTIFKNPNAVSASALPASTMGKQIAATMGGFNRIQTNTNGTFKRIVNGEQVGKAIRGEFNAIIVDMLAKPSLEYYASAYDPDAKGTAPDCFSHLGDKPEAGASNRQAANCATCKHRIDGSGANGKGKACRVKRKVALLLEGDTSGDVYQFNIPAKSLFGKGSGNTHPYEAYCRHLVANGTSPDRVVTTIAYNLDAETMELNFTAERFITAEELEVVQGAQDNPATRRLIEISAADADGVKPVAKQEEQPAAAPVAKPKPSFLDDSEDEEIEDAEAEEIEEPKAKRAPKKEAPAVATGDLSSVIDAWGDEDD